MTLTFDQWMQVVDVMLMRLTSHSSDGLPDWDYRKAYDARMQPVPAARAAAEAATHF
ncbi:hypothetical protein LCGC14_0876920 [marine sediment metagenome]|uniref:Uncharacterized protein n=1 Tax=marine sediment metagenome TaxID=412755 RepID=A0A0F9P7X9_9ZZZZ